MTRLRKPKSSQKGGKDTKIFKKPRFLFGTMQFLKGFLGAFFYKMQYFLFLKKILFYTVIKNTGLAE
jgi:hypothetical protein